MTRIRYTTRYAPGLGSNSPLAPVFRRYVMREMRPVWDTMVEEMKQRSEAHPKIAAAYKSEEVVNDLRFGMKLLNTEPTWKWKEYDTKGWPRKLPPWSPGTALWVWARAHNVPPYLLARFIQREGTRGNHIAADTRRYYNAGIKYAIERGTSKFLRDSLTGKIKA